jgi:ATP-dependent helicase HrpB
LIAPALERTLGRVDLQRTGLPLLPHLQRIDSLLAERRALVLTAEPGAGKSTLVPPYLLDAEWLGGRKILMLEPRRLAAAAVASRIAELLEEPLGRRAGYRVRSASCVGPETRIEIVTEALLTRRIQEDPLLEGVGLVIFDEFHERSIHADLGLALALEVKNVRPDLALLVMSATLDGGRVAEVLGGAPALSCPGRQFPVETRYSPLGGRTRWEDELAEKTAGLFDETEGDILVFLPGFREIRMVGSRLGERLGGRADILTLHGTMPLEEQRRVMAEGRLRRIILSTSIAETSLTVPGIRTVADSGWARISRFHPATGLDRLVTERESSASADQRRGRAGRLGPGLCVRFWKETDSLFPESEPEILRSDLAGLVLECAIWGAGDPRSLRWLDPPPASSCAQAQEVLGMLGLVSSGHPTARGREAAALGLHPRLGVLALQGAGGIAAACAAILSERDGSGLREDPDLRVRLEMLRTETGGSSEWRGRVRRETERILRRIGEAKGGGAECGGVPPQASLRAPPPRAALDAPGHPTRRGTAAGPRAAGWTARDEERIGALLAAAYPDRIGRRGPDGAYRFASGRAAVFPAHAAGPGLARTQAPSRAAEEWIVAPDADAGDLTGKIFLAAPLDRRTAMQALAPLTEDIREIRWDGMTPKGFSIRKAGRLVLEEKPAGLTAEETTASLQDRIRESGLEILPWDERTRALLARMNFLARHAGREGSREPSDDLPRTLCSHMNTAGGPAVTPDRLFSALKAVLGNGAELLRNRVPETLTLPTGHGRRIEYSSGTPTVEARIQEVFGLMASPKVCGVPIVFRLLSPARRPLQVTGDLAGFWRTTYAEVRKEMRGRYPRHYWPEDPKNAEPITGVRPKGMSARRR